MKTKLLFLAAFSAVGLAKGSVTLQFSTTTIHVSGFQNGSGSINGPEARMVWGVIVDGDGDGFDGAGPTIPYDDGFSLASNNAGVSLNFWDQAPTDDRLYIAGALMAQNASAMDGTAIGDNRLLTFANLLFSGNIGTGDQFAVVWFNVTALGGTAGEGLRYGILENAGFVLPNDGSTIPYGAPFAGPDTPKPLTGFLGVPVPEPSSALLGLLGMVGLTRRRRC